MTSFAANLNALQDGIDSIRASHSSLVSQQDELKRLIVPLTASFVGEWSQNFEGTKQKWDADASNVYDILRNLLIALETAHINYTNVGAAVARAMTPGG
jgi:uncharacterized protein YukE